jgi:hypothetical protein
MVQQQPVRLLVLSAGHLLWSIRIAGFHLSKVHRAAGEQWQPKQQGQLSMMAL